jgi:hypothetical protein
MSSLKTFLEKIPSIAVPDKITQKTLYALGYKSKNDRPIITVLKFIGFLNSDGATNQNYISFRSKEQSGAIMAKCLKSAYSELFGLYEDAHRRTTDELRDFFSTRTKGGDLVLSLTVNTFKTLCEFADFGAPLLEIEGVKEGEKVEKVIKKEELIRQVPEGVTINLNIQITLPVTDDAEVYDKIFKALKEHIFSRS